MISREHARHEARHCVAAWMVGGFRVDALHVGVHAPTEGLMQWSRVGGDDTEAGVGSLIVALCGWLGDPDLPPNAIWPEPYLPRLNAPERVGVITRQLDLSREQYEGICRIAKDLVEQETFKEAVELVARGLMVAPSLDYEALEILREAAGFGEPERDGEGRSPEAFAAITRNGRRRAP